MAAIFQDGRHSFQYETVFALNIVKVMTLSWSVHQNTCFLTRGIEFCNQNFNTIKRYSDMMTIIWTGTVSVTLPNGCGISKCCDRSTILVLQQTEVTCLNLAWIIVLLCIFTATQLCALQDVAIAFVWSPTFTRATTFCQLLTGLSSSWEGWRKNFPDFTFLRDPVARTFRLHCTICWLAPYASSWECRSSNALVGGIES